MKALHARPRSLFPDVRIVHRGVTIFSISRNSLLAECLPPVSTGSDSSRTPLSDYVAPNTDLLLPYQAGKLAAYFLMHE